MLPSTRLSVQPGIGRRLLAMLLVAGAAGLLQTAPASAQRGPDYLIGSPEGTLTVRGGLNLLRQSSDIFEHSREFLTLGRGDLVGGTLLGDLAFRVAPRYDVMVSGGYSRSSAPSDFRDWVDQDERPIEQATSLTTMPLTVNVKAYLTDRGRSVGNFAYIPAKFAPYAGVGAGAIWHRFRQEGDFVDFETLNVFTSRLESDGFAPLVQGFIGADLTFSRHMALSLEARFQRARANMGAQFEGFDSIDLSGLQTTVGLHIRL